MKSLLLSEYNHLEIADMPQPVAGPNELLIRVEACGICGSDVHGFDGSTGRRIPPLVMGHEAAGVVERVGSAVRDIAAGDRVTFDSTIYCGRCFFCARGEVNLCDNREVMGVSPGPYRRHGAFAEFVAVPRRIVYKLPDTLSFEQAALIEAASVAIHAVNLTPVHLGDTAVVLGAGMIGVLTIQALRLAGCTQVIAVDLEDSRLEMARAVGATETMRASADVPAAVLAHTDGHGAAVAVECVGAEPPIRAAIGSVRKGGAVTLVGNVTPQVAIPLQDVVTRQIRLQGSCASNGEYPAAIALMASGALRVDPLISAVAPLTEGAQWFDRLYRREPGLMKVILRP